MIVHDSRIRLLAEAPERSGDYVLYWMQQSQRAEHNPALEFAVQQANAAGRPLLVVFGVTDGYPEANLRHYRFMLEGIREVDAALRRRRIAFRVRIGRPDDIAIEAARHASMVVTDRGYLRHQVSWRRRVAAEVDRAIYQVEGDVVVPVEVPTNRAEYAARTLRPKLMRHVGDYLVELPPTRLRRTDPSLGDDGIDLHDLDHVLARLDLDRTVPSVESLFRGGSATARGRLEEFLRNGFDVYAATRNQPQTANVSHLAMHLHFGQLSPVLIALAVRGARPGADRDAFLEELIVRRELAHNFVAFTADYDCYEAIPGWARRTLEMHARDERPHVYTREEFEAAQTHDVYWNAAMREMRHTGYLHNYMRMYWGKKILEWSAAPDEAYRTAIELNNRYLLDGRDANSYAGVGWIFGLHDRPWPERAVFGTVRSMTAAGLRRKADPDAYVERVERTIAALRAPASGESSVSGT